MFAGSYSQQYCSERNIVVWKVLRCKEFCLRQKEITRRCKLTSSSSKDHRSVSPVSPDLHLRRYALRLITRERDVVNYDLDHDVVGQQGHGVRRREEEERDETVDSLELWIGERNKG